MANEHPFGSWGLRLHRYGLVVFPTTGPDGKKAAITHWQKRRSSPVLEKLCEKMSHYNVAVAVGASGYVVVDVDEADGDPLQLAFDAFGSTPLVCRTPRGGLHLWYRRCGPVRSGPFRHTGLKGDIKSDGGYVVVPPSVNPATGGSYSLLVGDWDCLAELPEYSNPLPQLEAPVRAAKAGGISAAMTSAGKILEGQRNSELFHIGLGLAADAVNVDDLQRALLAANDAVMQPPLPTGEVLRIGASLWRYRSQNRLFQPGKGFVALSDREAKLLKINNGEDALALLVVLKRSHTALDRTFCIAAEAMARDQVINGWGPKRYARARNLLLEHGFIVCTKEHRRAPGARHVPAEYRLSRPSADLADNVTHTPPPSLSPAVVDHELTLDLNGPQTRCGWMLEMVWTLHSGGIDPVCGGIWLKPQGQLLHGAGA